jgi:hypothetical protein
MLGGEGAPLLRARVEYGLNLPVRVAARPPTRAIRALIKGAAGLRRALRVDRCSHSSSIAVGGRLNWRRLTPAPDELKASGPPAASRPHSYGVPVSAPGRTPCSQIVRSGRLVFGHDVLVPGESSTVRCMRASDVAVRSRMEHADVPALRWSLTKAAASDATTAGRARSSPARPQDLTRGIGRRDPVQRREASGQACRYRRFGTTSCHSWRVRSRPAARHAKRSQVRTSVGH